MAEAVKDSYIIKPKVTKSEVLAAAEAVRARFPEIQARLQALEYYTNAPLPNRAEHLWRYSDPAVFFPEGQVVSGGFEETTTFKQESPVDGSRIVLFADRSPEIRLDPAAVAAGLEVEPLATSAMGAALVGKAVPHDHGVFESLNAAIWSQGIFVRLKQRAKLDHPLRLLRSASARSATTRVVILVEEGASLTLAEEHAGGGEGHTVLAISELFVKQDARLNHALFQQWDDGTRGHVTSRAVLGRDAFIQTAVITLGGSHYKADIGIVLNGEGAESRLVGVSLSAGRRHSDLHTIHDHRGPRTRSHIAYKAALFDRSTSVYTGLIRIAKSAEHSEAFQENRNLLLSDRCRADSIPELEIETNEVQCTHAATAAPIDESQLFYLKSRGISEVDAVAMLVRGFFEDALSPLPEALKPAIESAVNRKTAERYRGGLSWLGSGR